MCVFHCRDCSGHIEEEEEDGNETRGQRIIHDRCCLLFFITVVVSMGDQCNECKRHVLHLPVADDVRA